MPPEPPGRDSTHRRWMGRAVIGALAVLIVSSAVAAIRTIGAFLSSSQSVAHSREVVELLDDVKTMVVDAETGMRGFVLTGQAEYLAPFDAAVSRVDGTLARLSTEMANDPAQMDRLHALQPLIQAKMAFLQRTRAVRRDAGFDAAAAMVASGDGRRLMDAARAQVAALRSAELDLLQAREQETARDLTRAEQLLSLLALGTITLLAIAIILVERDFTRAARRIGSEVAARREGEVLLGEQEEQVRAVRDSIIDAIITIDEDGIIQTANPATEQLFGYRIQEMTGQNVKMLMPAPYRDEHDGYLRAYRASGLRKIIGIGREVTARRSDGSTFPVDLAVSEATVGYRRLFTGVLRDLSERQRADADVKELQRQVQERARLADIGAVTAQIVHDLGNPLAGLSMQVQRLARLIRRHPGQFSEVAVGVADQVLVSVRRLDGMLRELGDFSRQQRLDLAAVDPARFLGAVGEAWQPVAAARGIRLRVELSAADWPIVADHAKLFRVLDNLIKNAIEAIGSGPGEVCLRLAAFDSPHPTVRISISDDGPGIPDDVDAFRLFETTKRGGSGLGLPIARRIVEAHGGGLTWAARTPRGTVFHIDLPVRLDAGQHPGDPSA